MPDGPKLARRDYEVGGNGAVPNVVPVPCLNQLSQEIGVREHTGSETRRINDVAGDFEASVPVFPGNDTNTNVVACAGHQRAT